MQKLDEIMRVQQKFRMQIDTPLGIHSFFGAGAETCIYCSLQHSRGKPRCTYIGRKKSKLALKLSLWKSEKRNLSRVQNRERIPFGKPEFLTTRLRVARKSVQSG